MVLMTISSPLKGTHSEKPHIKEYDISTLTHSERPHIKEYDTSTLILNNQALH